MLSDDQRTALDELKGEALEVDTSPLQGRGGRGGGGGGGAEAAAAAAATLPTGGGRPATTTSRRLDKSRLEVHETPALDVEARRFFCFCGEACSPSRLSDVV